MEILEADVKKKIIQRIINSLSEKSPDLYYTDTMTISAMVQDYILEGNLKKIEADLVKKLSRHDIQTLMSYNSNCC